MLNITIVIIIEISKIHETIIKWNPIINCILEKSGGEEDTSNKMPIVLSAIIITAEIIPICCKRFLFILSNF